MIIVLAIFVIIVFQARPLLSRWLAILRKMALPREYQEANQQQRMVTNLSSCLEYYITNNSLNFRRPIGQGEM